MTVTRLLSLVTYLLRLICCDKCSQHHQDMQQKIFLTSRTLILQKCKHYLKKYGQFAWSRRRDLVLAFIIFYLSCKFILHLWYITIPKDEPSILCSFGRGNDPFCYFTISVRLDECKILPSILSQLCPNHNGSSICKIEHSNHFLLIFRPTRQPDVFLRDNVQFCQKTWSSLLRDPGAS